MSIRDDKEFMRLFGQCIDHCEILDWDAFKVSDYMLSDYIDKYVEDKCLEALHQDKVIKGYANEH